MTVVVRCRPRARARARREAPRGVLGVTTFGEFTCRARRFLPARARSWVKAHQILMGTWSLAKPHYHNFFWGKNTEDSFARVAGDKNSREVRFAVNQLLLRLWVEGKECLVPPGPPFIIHQPF